MTFNIRSVAKLLLLGLGCLTFRAQVDATVPSQPRNIVIVAESAGAQLYLSDNLSGVINEANLPFRVEVADWSTFNVQTDYQSQYNFTVKAQKLACRVTELRHTCPDARIFLVGNGAGGTVVVKAAEMLPPHQVQRVILLGPTLSCTYDLRRALLATCDGIDTFYCKQDLTLELAGQYRGTSDKKPGAAKCAGLNGFTPQVGAAGDAALYSRLRQCGIKESDFSDVNLCHLRYLSSSFLRKNVVPMLETSLRTRPCPSCSAPPAPPLPPAPAPKNPPPAPAPNYPSPPAPQSPAPPSYVPISPPTQAVPPASQPAPTLPPPFPTGR